MKILASDFDNTLFVSNQDAFHKNIQAIKKFIAYGNIFCIITGRNYSYLKQELNKYNIPYSYLICADGAKIFNNMDYCIDTYLLSEKKINLVIPLFEKYNCKYYLDDGYNETTNKNDCIKVVGVFDNQKQAEQLNADINSLDVYSYISTEHINVVDKSVNKLNSLKRLCNLEQLPLSNLYVIGDEINDYNMLKNFKGALMKNHNPILDDLNKKEYDNLSDYIEELINN